MLIKGMIKKVPFIGKWAQQLFWHYSEARRPKAFLGSVNYWESRYAAGGNSGVGSYNKFAAFKAETLNTFVANNNIESVIELGCGDGNQLALSNYPHYIGFDVSPTVIQACNSKFASDTTKAFKLISDYSGETADLALSLDVIYHLVEDDIFEQYMKTLFNCSNRYIIIYASDSDDNKGYEETHVRHRKFSTWIKENNSSWSLIKHIPNKYPYTGDYKTGSFADFYIYKKR